MEIISVSRMESLLLCCFWGTGIPLDSIKGKSKRYATCLSCCCIILEDKCRLESWNWFRQDYGAERWYADIHDVSFFLYSVCFLSCPPSVIVKEVLSSVQRLTFYGFLMALTKHHGINTVLGKEADLVVWYSPWNLTPGKHAFVQATKLCKRAFLCRQ